MVDALWKPITVLLFLMEHAIVTAVFICSFLIAFLLKKNDGRNGLLLVVIAFSPMDCDRGLFLPHVTRRFDTTLDKFGNPDTNVSVGLLSKHFVRNFVDNKVF